MPDTQTLPGREVTPTNYTLWVDDKFEPAKVWKEHFADWISRVHKLEELSKAHVYENPNLHDSDLRQHRQGLYVLMAKGEELAVNLYILVSQNSLDNPEAGSFMAQIDLVIGNLYKVLGEWHGTVYGQSDLPPELVKAFEEVDRGKLKDFEQGLTDASKVQV